MHRSGIFKLSYKRIPGLEDELADYLHLSGIRGKWLVSQVSDIQGHMELERSIVCLHGS